MKKIFRKFTLLLLLVPFLNSCDLDPINYSDIPSIRRGFTIDGAFVLLSSAR